MIQRIQSVYLLVVALLNWTCAGYLKLWKENGVWIRAVDSTPLLCLFLTAGLGAFVAIFLFKSRKSQFVLNRLNMLLNLGILGLLCYDLLHLAGGLENSEGGIGLLAPLLSIVLLVMANRRIKRDEDLVKSVDRIR